jgi:adenosine deaminase
MGGLSQTLKTVMALLVVEGIVLEVSLTVSVTAGVMYPIRESL